MGRGSQIIQSLWPKNIHVGLTQKEKAAVLEYADFFVMDKTTRADLSNKRKEWIPFGKFEFPVQLASYPIASTAAKMMSCFIFLMSLSAIWNTTSTRENEVSKCLASECRGPP